MMNFLALLLVLFSTSAFSQQVNLLQNLNPGFESGKAKWSASGGSFTISSSSPFNGTNIASFDASSSAQTFRNTLVAVGAGLETRACMAGIWYKADSIAAGDYTLKAEDSTSAILNSAALDLTPTSGAWRLAFVSFICPSAATTIRLVITSAVSNPAAISLDDMWLGSPNNQMTAADPVEVVAHAYFATTANCASWTRTNTSLGAFSSDADCPAITVDTSSSAVTINAADTDLPQIVFSALPAGVYEVQASFSSNGASTAQVQYAISDGTSTKGVTTFGYDTGPTVRAAATTKGVFTHSGGAKTFAMFGASSTGAVLIENDADGKRLTFTVTRYPSASTSKVTLETQGWYVDANFTNGTNVTLGTSNVTSYTELVASDLTMVLNSGSATARTPCSTTNPPTGLTCSAGSESLGVAFTPPYAGKYLVCASFSHFIQVDDGENVGATFQLINTPINAQTYTANGNERITSRLENVTMGANSPVFLPNKVCGIFNFTTVTESVVRLMYTQGVGGTPDNSEVVTDASGGSGGSKDFNIKVIPLTQSFPQAVALSGTAQVGVNSGYKHRAAVINCDASASVVSDPGSLVSSVANIASGACVVTMNALFTSTPICVISHWLDTLSLGLIVNGKALSTTNFTSDCEDDASTACTSYDFVMMCEGT